MVVQYRFAIALESLKFSAVSRIVASFSARQRSKAALSSFTGRPMLPLPLCDFPIAASNARAACHPAAVRAMILSRRPCCRTT